MKEHYEKMITELDEIISLAREGWMTERDPAKKQATMNRINGLLDQRLKLMKARDAAAEMVA